MRIRILTISILTVFAVTMSVAAFAQDVKPIRLPEPKIDKSVTFADVLKNRKTSREYSPGNLSEQTLANLLWSAWGINRPDSGRRTAPSALNKQEMDIYVTTADGSYVYDAKTHSLAPISSGDIRTLTGKQSYFKDAAINLVFVADLSKMDGGDEAQKLLIASMDAGFISQNAYLYCAAEGLATVYRVSIDKPALAEALKLKPDQRIIGAQTVGLPKQK